MKLLFSHPTGNANVRAALKAFYNNDILHSFHTSIASFSNSILGQMGRFKPFRELNRRTFDNELQKLTYNYPYKELGRILSTKCKINSLIKHEIGYFSTDSVYNYLDTKVSNQIYKFKNIKSIYSYEDCSFESFKVAKQMGISCLYDLPIGYWRTARTLLDIERKNRPDWANTITGFQDSDKKLQKKDEELRMADHIFVASSFTKETLKDFHSELASVSVIPYGFPSISKQKKYDFNNDRPLKLLFVGSLSQRKGVANILETADYFGSSVSLTIVGHKVVNDCVPLNEGLKKHNWIPSLKHSSILELMHYSDVLLFPSLFEGFGLVITEAMSQGTPVITTNRTIGKDCITNNYDGWIVEAGCTKSLIHTIEGIFDSPNQVAEAGIAAQKTASSRSWLSYENEIVEKIKSFNL